MRPTIQRIIQSGMGSLSLRAPLFAALLVAVALPGAKAEDGRILRRVRESAGRQ